MKEEIKKIEEEMEEKWKGVLAQQVNNLRTIFCNYKTSKFNMLEPFFRKLSGRPSH